MPIVYAILEKLLKKFYIFKNSLINKKYHRNLSFGDMVIDRQEKGRLLGFGANTTVYDSALVIGDVQVGENTWIGPQTVLDGSHGLSVGSFCSLSAGVQIYTHDSVAWALSGGKRPYSGSSTVIGDCVYIGPQSVIQAGSNIGAHCVIGAGSLVRGSIPPWSIAYGCPARIYGTVYLDESPKGWGIRKIAE